jgi:hypothetical protein
LLRLSSQTTMFKPIFLYITKHISYPLAVTHYEQLQSHQTANKNDLCSFPWLVSIVSLTCPPYISRIPTILTASATSGSVTAYGDIDPLTHRSTRRTSLGRKLLAWPSCTCELRLRTFMSTGGSLIFGIEEIFIFGTWCSFSLSSCSGGVGFLIGFCLFS